jgi:hypothetical protein
VNPTPYIVLSLLMLSLAIAIHINGSAGLRTTVCRSADTKSILIGVDRPKKYARSAFMPSVEGGIALIGTERERDFAQTTWLVHLRWSCSVRDVSRSELNRVTLDIQNGTFSARADF